MRGSSPLARGLRGPLPGFGRGLRIIPARAGFTERPSGRLSRGPDHPRSRGVYVPAGRRGHGREDRERRIIPARAGFTSSSRTRTPPEKDHPRSRGVYNRSSSRRCIRDGSSPLARGLHTAARGHGVGAGIIPARAGFTRSACPSRRPSGDHPRSRGVYYPSVRVSGTMSGSSPLARGLLQLSVRD